VEVPTIDGMTMVTVPPGTRSSRKLRLRGRGVAGAGGQRGDQYVAIEIVPPAALSDRQRQLLEDFARSGPPDPRAEVPWK